MTTQRDCGAALGSEGADPVVSFSGIGGSGSAILLTSSAIGTVAGECMGNSEEYGPDNLFCTADDPQRSRGRLSPVYLSTGDTITTVNNADDFPDFDLGPQVASGKPFSCNDLAENRIRNQPKLAGGFASCNRPMIGDLIATNEVSLRRYTLRLASKLATSFTKRMLPGLDKT